MLSPVRLFRRFGEDLSQFTQRWVPDSWIICMLLTVVALLLAMFGAGASPQQAALAWGAGLWRLLELAMQFTILMTMAHACVSSPPVYRLMNRLASLPDPERPLQAVLVIGIFSLITAYLNWALSIVAGALFVPFVCRRNPKADVRILVAAAYLGLGTAFAGGLSASAPLILATPGNALLNVVNRLIPVTETLFTPFNLIFTPIFSLAGLLAVFALHPHRNPVTLTPEQIERILPAPPPARQPVTTPAQRLDQFPGWILLAAVLFAYPLGHSIVTRGFGATWTINAYNVVFIVAALLLHRRPGSFLNACRQGVGTTWGVILQFPFYAGIFGLMTETGLGAWLGHLFAEFATQKTFPLVVYIYSGFMNLFVPSAGSKWFIEAPYLIPAGRALGVSPGTIVMAYMYGDANTNLIQPFWAIPILAVTGLRFGEVVGYTLMVALVCMLVGIAGMWVMPPNL